MTIHTNEPSNTITHEIVTATCIHDTWIHDKIGKHAFQTTCARACLEEGIQQLIHFPCFKSGTNRRRADFGLTTGLFSRIIIASRHNHDLHTPKKHNQKNIKSTTKKT